MSKIEVKVPDIGDYDSVPVIDVLVADGDTVEKDQPLLVLESDKATMEVPAPAAGTVRGFTVKVGDKLSEGSAICTLEQTDKAQSAGEEPPSPPRSGGEGRGEEAVRQEHASSPAARPPSPQPSPPAGERGSESAAEVRIPDIGDYTNVPVIEVLVADGDSVEKDQPLLVLESDKATMEVPAPGAGVVEGLKLKVGDKVSQGDPVCSLRGAAAIERAEETPSPPRSGGEGGGEGAARREPAAAPAARPPSPQSVPSKGGSGRESAPPGAVPYAGPATRKFARELGVDLAQVKGSGSRGRIVVEDVQAFVKNQLAAPPASRLPPPASGIPPIPAVDFSQFGAIETKPLARIRKLSAQFLHRSWVNVPHVTQTDEADITELETFRKQASEELVGGGGPKLTLLPFLMKACAAAMKQYPEFNASLAPDGENLILKQYCHIGFAADTPNGLVVPVVRDVWNKGIAELARECAELAKKARDGKLKPDEMKGGCFSISSLGGIGGSHFTPIVNAPEVGILGVSKSQMKPVWDGKQFVPRLMCPLSLSYDHRVIDGAYAARFIVHLVRLIADIRRLSL